MAENDKIFLNFSTLITQSRLRQGFTTLRELYRAKNPSIDYQTWLHTEAGRRVPSASIVKKIGEILDIDKQAVLIAYCKDKFDDPAYHQALELFEHNRFANIDALLEARVHERTGEFVFTEEQVRAFQQDIRLRFFLTYTYDHELKTTFDRLATFFKMEQNEVKDIVDRLQSLRLVEVVEETVKRIYAHTNFPNNLDLFEVRKELLLKSLAFGLKSDSHITNYYVKITNESYKKVLGFFDFIEANLTKMDKEELDKVNSFPFQITITGNRISEGTINEEG